MTDVPAVAVLPPASAIATVAVNVPSSAYACVPVTTKLAPLAEIDPVDEWPSPQSIVALKSPTAPLGSASVNEATWELKVLPSLVEIVLPAAEIGRASSREREGVARG